MRVGLCGVLQQGRVRDEGGRFTKQCAALDGVQASSSGVVFATANARELVKIPVTNEVGTDAANQYQLVDSSVACVFGILM